MKMFKKYLNVTLPFWIIILAATIFFTAFFSGINVKMFNEQNFDISAVSVGTRQYDTYCMSFNLFEIVFNFFSFSDFFLYGLVFAAVMIVILAIYNGMYKGSGPQSVFLRLPFKKGMPELYSFIMGSVIIAANVLVFACITIPPCVKRIWLLSKFSAPFFLEIYSCLQLRTDLAIAGALLAYLLAVFAIIFLCKSLFKHEFFGYITALGILWYMINAEFSYTWDQSNIIAHMISYLLIYAVCAGFSFLILKTADYSKHKVFVFPIAGYVLAGFVLLVLNFDFSYIWSYGYDFGFMFFVDIFLIIAAIVCIIMKKKGKSFFKSDSKAIKTHFSRLGVVKDIYSKYAIVIAALSVIVVYFYNIREINGLLSQLEFFSVVPNDINPSFEALIHPHIIGNCYRFTSAFTFLMIAYAIIKLITFLFTSHSLCERLELLPIKKRTLFVTKFIADIAFMTIPLAVLTVSMIIGNGIIGSNFSKWMTAADSYSPYTTMMIYIGLFYITCGCVVAALVNYADISVSSSILKTIFAAIECFAFAVINLIFEFSIEFDSIYCYRYEGNLSQIIKESKTVNISLIFLTATAFIFLLGFIFCRMPMSGNAFRTKTGRYVFVLFILALMALPLIFGEMTTIQTILGGIVILATGILLCTKTISLDQS